MVLAVVVVVPAIEALLVGAATARKWDAHAHFQYAAAFVGGLFGLTGDCCWGGWLELAIKNQPGTADEWDWGALRMRSVIL